MEIRIGWRLDSDGDLSWMMIEIGFDNYLTCVDHQTVARYMQYIQCAYIIQDRFKIV